jgi:hypothetical protein
MHDTRIVAAFSRAVDLTKRHSGSLWFPVIGGAVAAFIAWLAGVTVTFFPGLSEGMVRAALDVAVCVVIAYVLYFIGLSIWFLVKEWFGRHLNPWLVIATVGAVVVLGGVSGYIWDRSRGPIIWVLGSPLDWQRVPNGPLQIIGFQITGTNRWDKPIIPISSVIESGINKRTISLMITASVSRGNIMLEKDVVPSKVAIPPGIPFRISGYLPPSDPARASLSQFRTEFSRFTFIFKYEGGGDGYRISFSEAEVNRLISVAESASEPRAPSEPRGVMLKPD